MGLNNKTTILSEKNIRFNEEAMKIFNGLKESVPELDSVKCFEDNCSGGVVYFTFNKIPSDFDLIMRGNTVSFSSLKQKRLSGSYVTIIAKYQNMEIMKCDGNSGVVKKCTNLLVK